jgi:hypothetical protein
VASGRKPREGDGAFYYTVSDEAELDWKWPKFLATKPDFVKTYLLFSEDYALRKSDPRYFGWKGMDPGLLKSLVQKAHAAGLRVSTHVESAVDFHNALAAGVDEINHLPGSGPAATSSHTCSESLKSLRLMWRWPLIMAYIWSPPSVMPHK